MEPSDGGSAMLRKLRAETLVKDDGRYLIYYSWPDDQPADEAASEPSRERPPQQPWSPETGPGDV